MKHPLTRYREENGISAAALAQSASTSRQTIYRIEAFEQLPSLSMVRRIVDATNGAVSANDFLAVDSEKGAA